MLVISSCSNPLDLLAYFLYDEEEIHLGAPESLNSNVRDYRYDLTIQVIQELL